MNQYAAQLSKLALTTIQLAGIILSGLLVAATFASQDQVEKHLRQFAITKVEDAAQEVWDERLSPEASGTRTQKLLALSDRFDVDAQMLEEKRKEIVQAILASAKSESCATDCNFWMASHTLMNAAMLERISHMRIGQSTLQDFILQRYEESVIGLQVDLRRFGMVNIVVLSLMLGLTVFKNLLNWRFAAFSTGLTAYTMWAGYDYLYGQNWALTILFQNWAAPTYQFMMMFVAAILFDWLFLKGKITDTCVTALSKSSSC